MFEDFTKVEISDDAGKDIMRDMDNISLSIEAQKAKSSSQDAAEIAIFILGMMYQQVRQGGNREILE